MDELKENLQDSSDPLVEKLKEISRQLAIKQGCKKAAKIIIEINLQLDTNNVIINLTHYDL